MKFTATNKKYIKFYGHYACLAAYYTYEFDGEGGCECANRTLNQSIPNGKQWRIGDGLINAGRALIAAGYAPESHKAHDIVTVAAAMESMGRAVFRTLERTALNDLQQRWFPLAGTITIQHALNHVNPRNFAVRP